MADKDILQNMITQLGQSQGERMPAELDVHFVGPDENTTADLMKFARAFASMVKYYPADGGEVVNWAPFFDENDASITRLIGEKSGEVPPHLALFLAFLELYKKPQQLLNDITGRHLDFYYRDVLRLAEKPAVPDRAHVALELKKAAVPVLLRPSHAFNGGKDATGVERIYSPVRDTIINTARIDSLRSIFLDRSGRGTLRYAPIANSSDGLGGKFMGEPRWQGFGGTHLPPGELGFALGSQVLRMKEGRRTVRLRMGLTGADGSKNVTGVRGGTAFDVFVTGEKKWLGPIPAASTLAPDGMLAIEFVVDEKEGAVVDYNAAVHGYAYAEGAPVVQVLLRGGSGYLDFENMAVRNAEIQVDVTGITSMILESDAGTLDPKKAFLPFGPQPTAGSRFMVGHAEALSKRLSRLSLSLVWKDVHTSGNFTTQYAGYGVNVSNRYFTATAKFRDGGGHEFVQSHQLFNTDNALAEHEIVVTAAGTQSTTLEFSSIPIERKIHALYSVGNYRTAAEAVRYMLRMPVFSTVRPSLPATREGQITFFLDRDFLHATYRRKSVEILIKKATGTEVDLLNEPYTPTVQSISLSYSAYSQRANIASATLDDFAGSDVQFYHITPTGSRREHGYLRQGLGFPTDRNVTFLPAYHHEGELLIGLADLSPGDSVSMLFQVAEGSADPELQSQPIEWYVLSDNHWKRLGMGELVLDTTNGLLVSGLVGIVIPGDATTTNTVLPAGRIWIKAAVRRQVRAVCQLIDVVANVIEVRFADQGNDPRHLDSPLMAGNIAKLKTPVATVKGIKQPYASFGGSPVETSQAYHMRVSERLRHKNRCITIWDYERVVLETFPRIHRVKCIPHAAEGSWKAPGNVMLVVIPDLRNMNALDPLQPRADSDTISRITRHVTAHAGMGVRVKVKNPRYQKIRLDFKVRFHEGYEFNYYRNLLEQELIRTLSPWAFDASREISFGGVIYKSVMLDVVEDLEYVDYVTDFRMYSHSGGSNNMTDRNEARAETPDMVLVSDASHTIVEIPR